jgi:hypothetical protein
MLFFKSARRKSRISAEPVRRTDGEYPRLDGQDGRKDGQLRDCQPEQQKATQRSGKSCQAVGFALQLPASSNRGRFQVLNRPLSLKKNYI